MTIKPQKIIFFPFKWAGYGARRLLAVEDSPPFGGRGIPFYLSQFVSILGNLYPDRGVKGPFLGMFEKMDLCKKILIQAYTSLI